MNLTESEKALITAQTLAIIEALNKLRPLNTKHTPGPWEWSGDTLCSGTVEVLKAGDDGKSYGLHSAQLQMDNEAPDKTLIASAPELLAALQSITEVLNADDPDSYRSDDAEGAADTAFAIATKVIAKATGEAVS